MMSGQKMLQPPKEENEIMTELQNELQKLPAHMIQFGGALRTLYSTELVTGNDPSVKTFIEVRDNTRNNAMVYSEKVLPMTEEVVQIIGFFATYFTSLSFEDWEECLDETIEDLTKAQAFCEMLKQMHNTIIIDLKRHEDKANLGINAMEKMDKKVEEELKKMRDATVHKIVESAFLEKFAEEADSEAKDKLWWGKVLAPITLGISYWIKSQEVAELDMMKKKMENMAAEADKESMLTMKMATAKAENHKIAQRASAITKGVLIPAMKDFLDGLQICSMFLTDTKTKLNDMQRSGEHGAKKAFYKMMQKSAAELKISTTKFLAMTDMMRNELAAIPTEGHDMNYADKWFEQQRLKFANENEGSWENIKVPVEKATQKIKKKKKLF